MKERKNENSIPFSGRGTIWSYTKIIDAPKDFESFSPYYVALVKLEEGPLVTAQLTDLDTDPTIGMEVEMVTRILKYDGDPERGIVVYGYKFRPPITKKD